MAMPCGCNLGQYGFIILEKGLPSVPRSGEYDFKATLSSSETVIWIKFMMQQFRDPYLLPEEMDTLPVSQETITETLYHQTGQTVEYVDFVRNEAWPQRSREEFSGALILALYNTMDVNRFLYFVYYYKKRDDPRGKDILAKHRVDGVVKDFLLQNCDVMPKIWNNGNGFVLRDVTLSSYVLSGRHSRQWIPGNFGAAMRVNQ
eukprot:78723_1